MIYLTQQILGWKIQCSRSRGRELKIAYLIHCFHAAV